MTGGRDIVVRPARGVHGSLRLPGDKSISHRYALLGALARGVTRLENFATGADCASTLSCLQGLGCEVECQQSGVQLHGRGGALLPPRAVLDCGNSGSTMRMLAGVLAAQDFASELCGDASLSRRPMGRVVTPLSRMGAEISTAAGEVPPLRIRGGGLRGIAYRMPVASAQVKSAVLFAGLQAEGETSVEEPVPTRDHGELALRAFGAEVRHDRLRCSIAGGQALRALEAAIPGDISTAAFFLSAAALFPGSNLVLDAVLLNPTRAAVLDFLASMGLRIAMLDVSEHHGELVGTVRAEGSNTLAGGRIAGRQTAALIDELPVLAALAPFTSQGIEIHDAGELRVKESDRISAIAESLRRLGAEVEARPDGLRIPGQQQLHGGEIDSLGDHRIAMAFAVAALRATGDVLIRNAAAARVSYPGFFTALQQVAQR
jgi:3-phosphoshikimate 1-carboxyvinyltransferase